MKLHIMSRGVARRSGLFAIALFGLAGPFSAANAAESAHVEIKRQDWTFSGITGYFDQQQLRRGYKVYKNVCANCHSMKLLSYRNLAQPGGPEFPVQVAEQIASEAQVTDGPNDAGEMFQRPGKLSDRFTWNFKNDKEAAAANNGALPPDLSVMTKARTVESNSAWYLFPVEMVRDLATQYQEAGSDYMYALLVGYAEPPAGKEVPAGLYYNKAYPGQQLAMPQPMQDGSVEYEDGTPATLENYSKDVTAFMAWAAEPHLVQRKKLGLVVMAYLAVLALLLFLSKRALWRDIKH